MVVLSHQNTEEEEEELQRSTFRTAQRKRKKPQPSTSRSSQPKRKKWKTEDKDFLPLTKNPDKVQFSLADCIQKPLSSIFSATQKRFQSFSTIFSEEIVNLST